MSGFAAGAHTALANPQLRRNLANATGTIRAKRAVAVGELPDWAELRDAGAAMKAHALATLPAQLEALEAAVQAAGGTVHWARRPGGERDRRRNRPPPRGAGGGQGQVYGNRGDPPERRARRGGRAGDRDRPRRADRPTGRRPALAHPRAGRPLRPSGDPAAVREDDRGRETIPDEPRAIADVARRYLRAQFLSARMAVSGANFAVAETGTVCVVESEGNGRYCLTLPNVLVTVMGIEKVIGEWRDLEVMLQLLARSATGERMNPYTSLWTGVHAGDGPQEFHLVLLDGGRTRVLADEVGRDALRCIRCSACLNVCPVYTRTGGHAYDSVYPGPIGAVLSAQLFGFERAGTLPWASSLCGACYEVCPVKIDIPSLLVHLRERINHETSGHRSERGLMRALTGLFGSPRAYAAAQLGARLMNGPLGRVARGPLGRWRAFRDLPVAPAASFRARWTERQRDQGGPS